MTQANNQERKMLFFPIVKFFFPIMKMKECLRFYICSEMKKGTITAPQDFKSIAQFPK